MLVLVAQTVFVSLTTDVVVFDTVLLTVTVLEGFKVDLTVAQFVTVFWSSVTGDVCLMVLVVVTLTVPAGRVVVRVFNTVTVLAGAVEVFLSVTTDVDATTTVVVAALRVVVLPVSLVVTVVVVDVDPGMVEVTYFVATEVDASMTVAGLRVLVFPIVLVVMTWVVAVLPGTVMIEVLTLVVKVETTVTVTVERPAARASRFIDPRSRSRRVRPEARSTDGLPNTTARGLRIATSPPKSRLS